MMSNECELLIIQLRIVIFCMPQRHHMYCNLVVGGIKANRSKFASRLRIAVVAHRTSSLGKIVSTRHHKHLSGRE